MVCVVREIGAEYVICTWGKGGSGQKPRGMPQQVERNRNRYTISIPRAMTNGAPLFHESITGGYCGMVLEDESK